MKGSARLYSNLIKDWDVKNLLLFLYIDGSKNPPRTQQ